MAGQTPFFGLAFFDFRDRLDLPVNVRKEIDRFLLIDKQLYGLYSIFGNGVIRGWNLSVDEGSISVAPGIGIINYLAVETTTAETITDFPANDVVDIYAIIVGGSVSSREVNFLYSRTPISGAVRLGRVSTLAGTLTLDESFRDEIGFLEVINDEIAKHRHRGSPSKINLPTETRGQLPASKIEDMSASKLTSGRVAVDRLPLQDHNDLENAGAFSHAALDSFARLVSSGNRELLGEVTSTNLMKLMTSWTYANPSLENNFQNYLPIIPGVTSDRYIDFEASNAVIDLNSGCISGRPAPVGQIRSIFWDDNQSFLTASDRNLVTVGFDSISLTRGGSSSTFIESFDRVSGSGVAIPNFTAQTIVNEDNVKVVSEGNTELRTQGLYSGKFSTDRTFTVIFNRAVPPSLRDWTLFDEIYLDVKSLSQTHAPVYMYFVSGEGASARKSSEYLILGADEVTENPDPELNGFERRIFSIGNQTRDDVREIVFFTDDTCSKHEFYIDNIYLKNQALFPPEGFVRFRYSSQVPVVFNSINFDSITPEGTSVVVKARVANAPSLLKRAAFTNALNSGDVFALEGTDIEIDVRLLSDEDRSLTPSLNLLELQFIVASEISGFSISDADQWDRGEYINSEREQNNFSFESFIKIADDVNVDNLYYSLRDVISEVGPEPDRIAVTGFQGEGWPMSPAEAFRYADTQGETGLQNPFSVYRLSDKSFIVADLENDRVVLADQFGNFKKALVSHNVTDSELFYPLVATFNPATSKLSIAFTQQIAIGDVDISRFRLWIGGSYIDLGANDVLIENPDLKILDIELSPDKASQLLNDSVEASIQIRPGAFPQEITLSASARQLIGVRGLRIRVGDISYVEGMFRPVFANVFSDGNWIVCNSRVTFDSDASSLADRLRVEVGETATYSVSVAPPGEGFVINWNTTVPTEIRDIVTFTSAPPGDQGTLSVSAPDDSDIGEYSIILTANYVNASDPSSNFSSQTTVILDVFDDEDEDDDDSLEYASVISVNPETLQVEYSFNNITFTDYTLGSVFEVEPGLWLMAGLSVLEDNIPIPAAQDAETFEEEAARKLAEYRGKVYLVDTASNAIAFEYDLPDGSYASDAVVDAFGNYVVAETSFLRNTGRIVKLDQSGNIIWQIGDGLFSKINDVRTLLNNNLIIST